MEQDYREMYLNEVLPRIYEAVRYWRQRGGMGMSDGDQRIIGWLAKTGLINSTD